MNNNIKNHLISGENIALLSKMCNSFLYSNKTKGVVKKDPIIQANNKLYFLYNMIVNSPSVPAHIKKEFIEYAVTNKDAFEIILASFCEIKEKGKIDDIQK